MNKENTPPQHMIIDTESLASQMVDVSNIYLNISQEVIITTEDKISLCLSKYLKGMEKKRGWIAPLGILISIFVAYFTSTFEKTIGLEGAVWEAIFIIAGLLCLGWLGFTVIGACKSKKVEDIIAELKRGLPVTIQSASEPEPCDTVSWE